MAIIIENLQTKIPLNIPRAKSILQKIIKQERLSVEYLSYNFVTHQKIKQLNKKFLKREYTTDVLAFDLRPSKSKAVAGDIIISVDAAKAQSKEYGTTVAYELVLYMVHGLLHLLGYDDHAPKDIQNMRRKEAQVMRYLQKLYPQIILP